jgi:hypothetical protein
MISDLWLDIWKKLDVEAYELHKVARKEYATEDDIFHNFREQAAMSGITPRQAILTALAKHLISIQRDVSLREPMKGRYIDVMNYLRLLYAWDISKGME